MASTGIQNPFASVDSATEAFAAPAAHHRIRVLVVDDHPAICEALSTVISVEPDLEFAGAVRTAALAVGMVVNCKPDVVILDLLLGDAYGLSLVGEIRAACPDAQVVIYSMSKESIFAERVLRAGALGIVSKVEPTSVVLDAIRAAHNGKAFVGRDLALRLLGVRLKGSEGGRQGFDRLTDQEMTVVHLLHMGHTVDRIARLLKVNQKTVQAYHRRAREKLGCETIGQLLQSMMGSA